MQQWPILKCISVLVCEVLQQFCKNIVIFGPFFGIFVFFLVQQLPHFAIITPSVVSCEQIVSTIKLLNASKNQLDFASNRRHQSTSVTNHAFSPATPIHHTQFLSMPCVASSTAHARYQNRQWSLSHKVTIVYCTTSYTRHKATTAMSPWHVGYVLQRALVNFVVSLRGRVILLIML